MDARFVSVAQELVAKEGREVLFDPKQCEASLNDYAKGEFKQERRLLIMAIETDCAKAIDTARNLQVCKQTQIRYLCEKLFINDTAAAKIVDLLALILRQDQSKSIVQPDQTPRIDKQASAIGALIAGTFGALIGMMVRPAFGMPIVCLIVAIGALIGWLIGWRNVIALLGGLVGTSFGATIGALIGVSIGALIGDIVGTEYTAIAGAVIGALTAGTFGALTGLMLGTRISDKAINKNRG
ncbi:MAG: hypothetical protein LBF86_09245 [Helicobacteraceae bacterium]|jgi:hypothetical protein|nr:hypothetical protein [Helicobacteraceae bacterium]